MKSNVVNCIVYDIFTLELLYPRLQNYVEKHFYTNPKAGSYLDEIFVFPKLPNTKLAGFE